MEITAPYNVLIFILLLAILYFEELPRQIQTMFNSIFGKLIFIIVLLGLLMHGHIILSVILTIYYFRTLSTVNILESFVPGGVTNHHIIEGKNRWFIERLMHEKPYLIEDSIITTEATQ